jgi:hypothetical protein
VTGAWATLVALAGTVAAVALEGVLFAAPTAFAVDQLGAVFGIAAAAVVVSAGSWALSAPLASRLAARATPAPEDRLRGRRWGLASRALRHGPVVGFVASSVLCGALVTTVLCARIRARHLVALAGLSSLLFGTATACAYGLASSAVLGR